MIAWSRILFPDLTEAELRERFWRGEHWFQHDGPLDRLSRIGDLPALRDHRSLIATHRGAFKVIRATAEHGHIEVPVADAAAARSFYDAGLTVHVGDVQAYLGGIERCLAGLEADLGYPAGDFGGAAVCASPPGGGFGRHYDRFHVFVVQLVGSKHWTLAANRDVTDPTETYVAGRTPLGDLQLINPEGAPREMPADAHTLELVPGSVLFVPRGTWHSTRASTHSLSLSLVFDPGSRLETLLGALRRRLVTDSRWRAPAIHESPRSACTFEQLLAELGHSLAQVAPAALAHDALARASNRRARVRYRKLAGSELVLVREPDETTTLVVRRPDEDHVEFTLEDELAPLFEWLRAHDAWFTGGDAVIAAPRASMRMVDEALELLVEHRLLQRSNCVEES
jgi:50S ribosomal protein L16 3-hydroxylase